MGMRESPKFFAVRMFGLVRSQLLSLGRQFVLAGELDAPDDLVYLTLVELRRLAGGEPFEWKPLVARRREAVARRPRLGETGQTTANSAGVASPACLVKRNPFNGRRRMGASTLG